MATPYQPMTDQSAMQQGAPSQASSTPDQQGGGQASQLQQLFAGWYRTAQEIAQHEPRVASGMEKVKAGVQEALAAIVQQQPPQQQPMY